MAAPRKKATRRRKKVERPLVYCEDCGEQVIDASYRDGELVRVNANPDESGDTYIGPHPWRDSPAKLAERVPRIAGGLTDPRNDYRTRYVAHTAEVCAARRELERPRW